MLGGSWARGDARAASDIDLWAYGLARAVPERTVDGFLVVVDASGERAERVRLRRPPFFGAAVPGWRAARILYDPDGIARRLRTEARRFRWERVARACDRWVARELVGWAEDVVKLVRALADGHAATASVQRNLIANRMAPIVAAHRRIFWDSENGLWERVAAAVGGPWARAQRGALGVPNVRHAASCRAALLLYAETAREVAATLSPTQRAVVDFALRTAGLGRPAPPVRRRSR